jgi:hypothetical protein
VAGSSASRSAIHYDQCKVLQLTKIKSNFCFSSFSALFSAAAAWEPSPSVFQASRSLSTAVPSARSNWESTMEPWPWGMISCSGQGKSEFPILNAKIYIMGGLVINRAACRAISARSRTTAHIPSDVNNVTFSYCRTKWII